MAQAERGKMNLTPEIYGLLADNKPLPPGTCLRGEPLSAFALEFANACPNSRSQHVPFWILGWRDLWDQLSVPTPIEPPNEIE